MKGMGPELIPKSKGSLPILVLLKLNSTLKRTLFSRKFYQEINDKVLSKSSTVDANLYFICYFTLLLSAIVENKPQIKKFLSLQKGNLLRLINTVYFKAINRQLLLKRENDAPKTEPQTAAVDSTAAEKPKLAVHLKAISSYISDIRIFNRLTESIKYMPWIIDEFGAMMNPTLSAPRLDRIINFAQSFNCLVLELLENAGWLTDHNWVGTSDNNYWCIETYIWCSRVWGAYLIIEIIELIRRTPMSKWDKSWKISLFKQVIQVPLVVHWSLYEGCLTPFWVGVCGSGASWWGFRDMWLSLDLN